MDVERVFHMKGGAGDTSYSKNSSLQKKVSDTAMKTTLDTLQELYLAMTPGSLGIADLGCSSGPNTLSIARAMIEAVEASRRRAEIPAPEIRVYLNDLPANDFNSVLAALPEFYRDLREIRSDNDDDDVSSNVFVAACAGSFYGRLFPAKCLHFIYSSNSLHWLSRVPPGIYNKQGKSINKDSIHISETSPPKVSLAYATQFQEDFSVFLRSRSKELVDGGRMVLIFLGRPGLDHFDRGNILLWKLLSQSFSILVSQGEVEKEKVDSYEVPYYAPCKEEIEAEVAKEGSFGIHRLEMIGIEIKGEYESGVSYGTILARTIRAVHEPMMRLHFGEGINLDALFETYGRMLDEELATEGIRPINFVLVLNKKGELITET